MLENFSDTKCCKTQSFLVANTVSYTQERKDRKSGKISRLKHIQDKLFKNTLQFGKYVCKYRMMSVL